MLNTNYCVSDGKYSRNQVYIVNFSREGGGRENAANAALRLILTRVARVHLDMGPYYNML